MRFFFQSGLQCGGVFLLTTCLARQLNWRLLLKTCCSMFKRSQSTDFTCAALQAVRILNICKTFHGIHVPLNFLFKVTGINLAQLNINPVEFHLIRLCSFCNIFMSNDVKFFEAPCIFGKTFQSLSFIKFFVLLIYNDSKNFVYHNKCHNLIFQSLQNRSYVHI